jgi:hypothetical protein
MKERAFFFAADIEAAKSIIADLEFLGLGEQDLHVIADQSIAMEPLPEPDIAHRSDLVEAAKRGALTGGSIGLIGSVVAVTLPAAGLALGGGAIIAGTALGTALGTWFSTLVGVSVPNQEVEQYRDRIERGEVMVIVDAEPESQDALVKMLKDRHSDTLLIHGNLDAA